MEPTTKRLAAKPEKPYPDFPLFPHTTRRWAKKVKGKMRYFGPWEDWRGALDEWNRQRDDLLAGREPHKSTGDVTVKEAVDAFLESRENKMHAGELSPRTFRDYLDTGKRIGDQLGRTTPVSSLTPSHFKAYAEKIAKWSPVTRGNEIQRVRTTFRYASKNNLIAAPVPFGSDFEKPSAKTQRQDRNAKPARFFSRDEIVKLLDAADVKMKAMILLAVNCGMGNSDVSGLDRRHLDLDRSILDYPRPKTAIDRRAMLWPETVKALRDVLAFADSPILNPKNKDLPHYHPENAADADAVFLTHQQLRYVVQDQTTNRDSVALMFGKLLRGAGIKKEGVNFYSLRHVFETVAGGVKDQPAVDRVMGHKSSHISAEYRHWLKDAEEDKRLKAVADHVRAWMFPEAVAKEKAEAAAKNAKKRGRAA
jgi:integrase